MKELLATIADPDRHFTCNLTAKTPTLKTGGRSRVNEMRGRQHAAVFQKGCSAAWVGTSTQDELSCSVEDKKMGKREPCHDPHWFVEDLRQNIARKLQIDPNRIRFGPLEMANKGKLGTEGDHWQIHYRDEWRELPWHPEGPQQVTRELVHKWHGVES